MTTEKNKVISLQPRGGELYTVRINDKDQIIEIISIGTDYNPKTKTVPDGMYQTSDGGLLVVVKDSQISLPKPGVKPRAVRVPAKGITKLMAAKRDERKKEISDLRMAGKI